MTLALRPSLVLFHRWAGLTLTGFLLLAGLTGALLVWYEELDAWVSPHLLRAAPPAPGAPMLDPLVLRQKVQAQYPGAYAAMAPLQQIPSHAAVMRLFALPASAAGPFQEPPNDQVFVNPYTGEMLGERKWGDITQGVKNLMPFIYRLHYSLALEKAGETLLGIVALLWTVDCFAGAWLTLPAPKRNKVAWQARPWLLRWWPSWKLRWRQDSYKLNFDLHRAGGLWVWAMLFVLAWSSVAFNLHQEVYDPVMRTLFAHQRDEQGQAQSLQPSRAPALDWAAARKTGQKLMAEQARLHGFSIIEETLMVHDPARGQHGIWRYQVRSSRDIRDRWGSTQVIFDADTGELLHIWLPTGAAAGDTIRTWLTSLHMAALWGTPFRLFMTGMGVAVVLLSATGLVIWMRKRQARVFARARDRAAAVLVGE
ncbi:MAG: PepSY-associated TM helix domain-containing protein [Acidovorax sp.]|nr:PepSY-associated TM helix domain-containing protein [Acidovorax sp.]